MKRKGGLTASYFLSPFYLYFTVLMVSLMAVIVMYQYYNPGVEAVLGGAVGCAAGSFVTGAKGCAVGAGLGATTATFLFGDTEDVGYHLAGAVDVRSTGSIATTVLRHNVGSGSLRSKLQTHLYCNAVDNPPPDCRRAAGAPARLQEAADEVIPDNRRYRLTVRYQQQELRATSEQVAFRRGPALYQYPLPMPGGTTATVELKIEGWRGGVTWQ